MLTTGRETFSTSPLDAEPTAVLQMPGDTKIPLLLAISVGVVAYGLLFSLLWLSALALVATAACAIVWLWPTDIRMHDEVTPTEFGELPVGPTGSHNIGWWGMACVVITEAAFFGYLLFSYFYLASMSTNPWPATSPQLVLPVINTLILVSSSVCVWLGTRAIKRDRRSGLSRWLGAGIALGVTFIVLQGVEYGREKLSMTHDAFGSLFYTITGFHGAHVIVGLVILTVVLVRSARGHFSAARRNAVENAALYWHFVDAVWLAVFTTLYLTPYLR